MDAVRASLPVGPRRRGGLSDCDRVTVRIRAQAATGYVAGRDDWRVVARLYRVVCRWVCPIKRIHVALDARFERDTRGRGFLVALGYTGIPALAEVEGTSRGGTRAGAQASRQPL